MLEVRYFLSESGHSPFEDWFLSLHAAARAKVTVAIARIGQGNLSRVKSVGEGVFERKMDFGPGYRVYFGRDGDRLAILLTGGTKKRQQRDIKAAKEFWKSYKRRKRER